MENPDLLKPEIIENDDADNSSRNCGMTKITQDDDKMMAFPIDAMQSSYYNSPFSPMCYPENEWRQMTGYLPLMEAAYYPKHKYYTTPYIWYVIPTHNTTNHWYSLYPYYRDYHGYHGHPYHHTYKWHHGYHNYKWNHMKPYHHTYKWHNKHPYHHNYNWNHAYPYYHNYKWNTPNYYNKQSNWNVSNPYNYISNWGGMHNPAYMLSQTNISTVEPTTFNRPIEEKFDYMDINGPVITLPYVDNIPLPNPTPAPFPTQKLNLWSKPIPPQPIPNTLIYTEKSATAPKQYPSPDFGPQGPYGPLGPMPGYNGNMGNMGNMNQGNNTNDTPIPPFGPIGPPPNMPPYVGPYTPGNNPFTWGNQKTKDQIPPPPPTYTPTLKKEFSNVGWDKVDLKAVDPGAIRPCKNRHVYLWLRNGMSFWCYPTYVGKHSLSGYKWNGRRWVYFGIDLKEISYFHCQ